MDTTIHATIIQQLTPEKDNSSAYYIFERLNTGGTPLQPQEIRAALYHGNFQDFLQRLNENKLWRSVFGKEHLRAKDQELLLRFFAFRNSRDSYKAPLKAFLNEFMSQNRTLSAKSQREFERQFVDALQFVVDAVGPRPFRPFRTLNAAVFDSVLVTVSENMKVLTGKPKAFRQRYQRLIENESFDRIVRRSTADEQSVIYRFDTARNTLVG